MKGLLIKDFKLLKNQGQFFGIIVLICIGCMFLYDDSTFAISYMTIVFSLFTLSTISYDEYNNGMAYLFTLPFSRKEYVQEKYVFGILTTTGALAGVSVLAFVSSAIRSSSFEIGVWAVGIVVSLLVAIILLTITIPLQLKFGAERSRIALLAVFGCCALAAYIAVTLVKTFGVDLTKIFDKLVHQRTLVLVVGGCLIGVLAIAVSYLVSLKIMNKKQF